MDFFDLSRLVGRATRAVERWIEPHPSLSVQEMERRATLFWGHSLYHFNISPFSFKVRRTMAKLGIRMPMRDTLEDPRALEELVAGGGKDQVPCLKIEVPGSPTRWMYESADIIHYLTEKLT
jgi:hypothetical protein